jgi:hypothetical protein
MALTCASAWLAIRRGARSLPWMGLALFAFSMTSLWPVYYIYYDVLLLFVSAAMVEAFRPALRMGVWLATLAAAVVLVAATTSAMTVAAPSIEIGAPGAQRALVEGFGATEREGSRHLVWVVSQRAAIALPRNSTAPADIAIDCRPFLAPGPPQVVTAMLNGQVLVTRQLHEGWQTIRMPAPRAAWQIGFNELEILSASIATLPATFPAEDLRPRALALSRIEVIPRDE